MLLEGKPVAEKIKKDIMTAVRGAKKDAGLSVPKVALLRVGENPEDVAYERKIIKNCQAVGIDSDVIALDQKVSMAEFMKVLEELNRTSEVHGIMIFRPLPSQWM
ncbi:MAG: tetrahydrofolate dehydrogenase/cyclohydrolase catalytic domain-containing protein [Bacillota bacterium]|nr:tetrahydrofolate dehydrogenase/cyclohydrolase catalytic domain-containing protein [Bacillota bacterium]